MLNTMDEEGKRKIAVSIFNKIMRSKRRRKRLTNLSLLLLHYRNRVRVLKMLLLATLLLTNRQCGSVAGRPRRLTRNNGWFDKLWRDYSGRRFKQALRVTKQTFNYILNTIRDDITRNTLCEAPICPEERLAIGLYKFGRGDYNRTICEMTGRGEETIREISNEVASVIVNNLWDIHVRFPQTEDEIMTRMNEMESLWQCTCAYAAVDGCHIPTKCPPGGAQARKEYYNFKNFYSIILMGIVDARYRFLWASSGLPGSVHDALILQSTSLYKKLLSGDMFPDMFKEIAGVKVPPILLGDSAFPHHTWLQKPYTNAILSDEESNFNYRLSRGRMVVECAFGQLKGRWRILSRKSEAYPDTMNTIILACVVLHNICIDKGDIIPSSSDLNFEGQSRVPSEVLREQLFMTKGKSRKNVSKGAIKVRDTLKSEFWREKQERA